MATRKEDHRRVRSARKDASVSSIERHVEKAYGLPSGSVQINRANGKNAYGNKRVGNLMKEYKQKGE